MEPGHYDREAVIERMRLALKLYEASEQMMRLNLRRRYPDADEEQSERRIIEWLHTRPGAEHGDVSGSRLHVYRTLESLRSSRAARD